MAHIILAVAKAISSGGAWVIGSKLFSHGIDRSSAQWRKLMANPQPWQQVTLNVGGAIFPTSRKTLLASPKLSSLLHNTDYMKSNDTAHIDKNQFWHEIADNEFFIDRDPTHFRYILNYIRNNKLCVLPTDIQTRKELSIEANFYELHGLVTMLNYNKQDTRDIEQVLETQKGIHIPSQSITRDEADALMTWIQENDNDGDDNELQRFELLYRASENDFSAAKFHDLCDDKGKTLVIIQATNGFIFGGYTHCSWNRHKNDSNRVGMDSGFVFLIRAYGETAGDTQTLRLSAGGNEVTGDHTMGPCFSDWIEIVDKCDEREENKAMVGLLFVNADKDKITESLKFQVQEYEVFQVLKTNDDAEMLKMY